MSPNVFQQIEKLRAENVELAASNAKFWEALQASKAENEKLRGVLVWANTVVGYYLDFHRREGNEDYDAMGCILAIQSALAKEDV